MKRAIRIGLILLFVQRLGLPQGRLTITSGSVPPGEYVLRMSSTAFQSRLSQLRPRNDADLGVKEALGDIGRMLPRATRLRPGANLGVTTFMYERYDSLLTKYEVSGVESIKTIVVLDTASVIVLLVPYQPSAFGTAESARRFLDEIVQWDNFRLGLQVRLVLDPTAKRLAGGGDPTGSSIRWPFEVRSSLIGRQTYLVWTCSKGYFRDVFSPELLDLPERFPPLSERLRSRSKEEVRSMLSALTGEWSLLSQRDDIILRELLRRGISPQEFSTLLVPVRGDIP